MKRIIHLLSAVLFLSVCSLSQQPQWQQIPMQLSTGDTDFFDWNAAMVSKNVGWYIGYGYPPKIFKTSDGGYNWQLVKAFGNTGVHQAFFLDSLHVWVRKGTNGERLHRVVFTHDGGASWDSSMVDTMAKFSWGPLFFFDSANGLLFGSRLFQTNDGARSWQAKSNQDTELVQVTRAVDCPSRTKAWIGGYHPTIVDQGFLGATTDGGISWHYQGDSNNTGEVRGIKFIDTLRGFAITDCCPPLIYSTTNGGTDWTVGYDPGGGITTCINFADSLHGWVTADHSPVSSDGHISATSDGGQTWVNVLITPNAPLRRISVLPKDNLVYVFGDHLTMLRSEIITDVLERKPARPQVFQLEQNYPNPFNPSTTISYSLENSGNVQLGIYTILGTRTRTLVNKFQSSGSYRIAWDGRNDDGYPVPSGVYICRLTLEHQSSYIKITLLK